MTAAADRLLSTFRSWTGQPSSGIWSAPGRVNLIGEHTDYNQGHVLPFAVSLRTRAAVRLRDDGRVRIRSLQRDEAGDGIAETTLEALPLATGWSAYAFGTIWALREAGLPVEGVDVVVDGRVPLGSGLSSSAALECAVALSLAELTGGSAGTRLTRMQLAQAGQRAENEVVGAPVGLMDQAASMLAEDGSALLLDTRTLDWRQIPLDPAAAGLTLLVIDTRVHHDLADGQYAERRRSCEQAAAVLGVPALRDATVGTVSAAASELGPVLLRRARHVVTEQQRVSDTVQALRSGDWRGVGRLLSASHASLRDDFEVSVPELDGAVEAAEQAGAYGARVTGGGFGGNVLALVPDGSVDAVGEAVRTRAAAQGWPRPDVLVVHPESGACREVESPRQPGPPGPAGPPDREPRTQPTGSAVKEDTSC